MPTKTLSYPDQRLGTDLPLFQTHQSRAEALLLNLADYIYVHTALKPMSKVLFTLSRLLLLTRYSQLPKEASLQDVTESYARLSKKFKISADTDDYHFDRILKECERHLPHVLDTVREVCMFSQGTDCLGLAFNTLIRGKFQAGEGLGTHLTPEEVVRPMVKMALGCLNSFRAPLLKNQNILFGDITGGTGRFTWALLDEILGSANISAEELSKRCYVFDQSRLSIELGHVNFLLKGFSGAHFELTDDSVVDSRVTDLAGKFGMLATNPPFGTNKYRWSPALPKIFNQKILHVLGFQGPESRIDPAEVFLLRNLELLASGGILAIVLPDGVAFSSRFKNLLGTYEEVAQVKITVRAVVSLPVATFALGGTVAKTSFLILQKNSVKTQDEPGIFAATAEHVGFLKRGNARIPDPGGNDLEKISENFLSRLNNLKSSTSTWRQATSLSPAWILHHTTSKTTGNGHVALEQLAELIREFEPTRTPQPNGRFHVSILDVDETGLIELRNASRNQPITKSLACQPGDILISCLNPKIWRVTVIPTKPKAAWTCSPEFAVLRPKDPRYVWRLFVALLQPEMSQQGIALAQGTSSSRQRIQKTKILSIRLPKKLGYEQLAVNLQKIREELYASRSQELGLLETALN